MSLVLRYYQQDGIDKINAAFNDRLGVIYCAPTASGKTVTAAALIKWWIEQGHRVLFVVHRYELMNQASEKFALVGIPHGLIAAGRRMDKAHPLQLAMVASLPKRKEGLDPDFIVFDECHHLGAPSWQLISNLFPKAKKLGLSATPQRLDRRPLAPPFSTIVYAPSQEELRRNGYLADFIHFAPNPTDLQAALAKVKVRMGDYDRTQLGQIMSGKVVIGNAVNHFRQLAGDRTGLAFCATVESSRALVAQLNAAGIPSRHADADTPILEREAAIAALASGEIRVLSNCELFTEGVDIPSIGVVILLRPTHSCALYLQMCGRAMRPNGNVIHLLDHAALVFEHDLPDRDREWTLDGASPTRRKNPQLRKCPSCDCIHNLSVGDCPHCGHVYEAPIRNGAVTVDGTLVNIRETFYAARKERPSESPAPEGLMNITDYAASRGISEQTVRNWIRAGMPTHVSA